jgi:drug/metabolite transporter (DMT)-like permease
MDAVLLGVLAGVLFGGMTVAVRSGLGRGADAATGAAVIASTAFATSVALALPSLLADVSFDELWPFFAIGLLVPGSSQIVFVLAIRHAGPSRAGILVGTAPLLSVLLAIALLDEPVRPWLLVGTALVVAGGATLVADRGRPVGYRRLGIVLALVCATLFALRDNAVRFAAEDFDPAPLQASAASLAAAALITAVYAAHRRARVTPGRLGPAVRAFAPAGVLLGFAYGALVTGFDRGDVGIVAPLNATQSLWAVVFAALLYRHTEAIGQRTFLAGVLVVAGGALIGVTR